MPVAVVAHARPVLHGQVRGLLLELVGRVAAVAHHGRAPTLRRRRPTRRAGPRTAPAARSTRSAYRARSASYSVRSLKPAWRFSRSVSSRSATARSPASLIRRSYSGPNRRRNRFDATAADEPGARGQRQHHDNDQDDESSCRHHALLPRTYVVGARWERDARQTPEEALRGRPTFAPLGANTPAAGLKPAPKPREARGRGDQTRNAFVGLAGCSSGQRPSTRRAVPAPGQFRRSQPGQPGSASRSSWSIVARSSPAATRRAAGAGRARLRG